MHPDRVTLFNALLLVGDDPIAKVELMEKHLDMRGIYGRERSWAYHDLRRAYDRWCNMQRWQSSNKEVDRKRLAQIKEAERDPRQRHRT